MRTWLALSVILLPTVPPIAAQQDSLFDWPVFRGNGAQTAASDVELPNALSVRWTYDAQNNLECAAIISHQRVYIGSTAGKLHAVDLMDGSLKWQYQAAGIMAAPAARDGAVYFGDVNGTFHCVDAATGKKRWTVAAQDDIVSSANFAGDKIIFGSDDHHLYCVSTEGKIVWRCKTKEKVRAAPAIVGDHVFVAGCDQHLHVVDLHTGKEVAAIPLGGHVGASAAVLGDHAFVGNMANKFLAVDWKKKTNLWTFEAKRGAQPFYSSAAVTNDLVVAGSRDKKVRAWARLTGKEVWSFSTNGRVDCSPVIAGQRVYVGSLDGNLYVLDLKSGIELARFALGPIPGSPAVGGQCVVVATFPGQVYCLAAKKK